MSNTKRNVTIAVVVLCICAAVYLNISYNKQSDADTVLSDASLLEMKNEEETLATAGLNDYVSEYFAQARLTRQQSRDEALNLLQTAATSQNASQETIDSAMNAISTMASYSMQEAQIENLLLAKDFADCVVFMSADGITVAIPASANGLSAEEVAKATDAILSETSYSATQLRIIEVKNPQESPLPADEAEIIGDGSEAGITNGIDIGTQGGYMEGETYIFE